MSETSSSAQNGQKQIKPIAPEVNELVARCKSVILGTVDAAGTPNASYAPFTRIGNKFYILVSFMARHTKNLRDQKKASVMFIDDESASKQIYARDRLTIDAATSQIERDTPEWGLAVEKLKEAHGKVLDVLVGMDDFIMIELSPLKGAYVNGFGSAYFVDEQLEIMQHRNDTGHTVRDNKS